MSYKSNLKIGTTEINTLYVGDKKILKIINGSGKVYYNSFVTINFKIQKEDSDESIYTFQRTLSIAQSPTYSIDIFNIDETNKINNALYNAHTNYEAIDKIYYTIDNTKKDEYNYLETNNSFTINLTNAELINEYDVIIKFTIKKNYQLEIQYYNEEGIKTTKSLSSSEDILYATDFDSSYLTRKSDEYYDYSFSHILINNKVKYGIDEPIYLSNFVGDDSGYPPIEFVFVFTKETKKYKFTIEIYDTSNEYILNNYELSINKVTKEVSEDWQSLITIDSEEYNNTYYVWGTASYSTDDESLDDSEKTFTNICSGYTNNDMVQKVADTLSFDSDITLRIRSVGYSIMYRVSCLMLNGAEEEQLKNQYIDCICDIQSDYYEKINIEDSIANSFEILNISGSPRDYNYSFMDRNGNIKTTKYTIAKLASLSPLDIDAYFEDIIEYGSLYKVAYIYINYN